MKFLPQILIAIGMLFTFWGGFLAFKRQANFRIEQEIISKENKELSLGNRELNKTNIELTKSNETIISRNVELTKTNQELIDKNIAITKGNQELAELNLNLGTQTKELTEKTMALTDKAKKFTVGSEELLKVDFREDFHNYTERITLMAMNKDEMPIFDLKMIITELYSMTQSESDNWREKSAKQYRQTGKPIPLKNKRHDIKMDVFQPQNYWAFGHLPKPMQNEIGHYFITVYTRARIYYMDTYVRKDDEGKWSSHSEYFDDVMKKNLIYTHTMKSFPLTSNGEPNKRGR